MAYTRSYQMPLDLIAVAGEGFTSGGELGSPGGPRVAPMSFTSVEVCAGAGGQALGLHMAGFDHLALVEMDRHACETLRLNGDRMGWAGRVHEADLNQWVPDIAPGTVTLVAGGVPCPPFSVAGKQLGPDDERDLFPALLDLVRHLQPRAVQVENVKGLLSSKFAAYRASVEAELLSMGYAAQWKLLNACDYGVPQLRPRTILVALRPEDMQHFKWPTPNPAPAPTVGEALLDTMSSGGWEDAIAWAQRANSIAPTLVGGSKKHGGPDLGPTRARSAWADLGVNGLGLGNDVPGPGFVGHPKLTVRQAAILQGFPEWWLFAGGKTASYRQVGNAFPPPVAHAVGSAIAQALMANRSARSRQRSSAA